jgi:hypothetical protein
MAARDLNKRGISLRGPHRRYMSENPKREPNKPQAQAESHRGRNRPVEDGKGARRTG